MSAPAIILVKPQLPENIGAAARAMANFGLNDLRLVTPREGWPQDKAFQMASSAQHILHAAKVFNTTEEAVADLHLLLGSSARDRRMVKPVLAPREAVQRLHEVGATEKRCGILFGAERTGLENEDIVRCEAIIEIPTTPEYASLNIAQALVVVAYEWFTGRASSEHSGRPKERQLYKGKGTTGPLANPVIQTAQPATQEEVQGFFNHLETYLDQADFWKNPDKKPLMWQNLRNIFTRNSLTEQEIRTLRGVIRCLVEDI